MTTSLKKIQIPIENELKEFDKHFKESMKSKVPLLDKITYYIVNRKGKQVRPMFVFLSAKMFGEVNAASYCTASLIELLHTASLVHDDVVDDAYQRRGFFSINSLWKNKIAVLVGDYLLSKGMLLALENDYFTILKICSRAVKDLIEGELLQLEKARKLDIEEDIYYEIIRKKTAALIASACSAGAYSTTEDDEVQRKMWKFGEDIGIAFQIKDDLFDYGHYDIGKPKGIDIKEKKMTLPLIYVLSQSTKKEKKWILNIVRKHNNDKRKVRELIDHVIAKGGLQYAEKAMLQYRDQALAMLDDLPDSASKTSMYDLVNFVVTRKK